MWYAKHDHRKIIDCSFVVASQFIENENKQIPNIPCKTKKQSILSLHDLALSSMQP